MVYVTSQNARVAGQPQPTALEANSNFISAYGFGGQLQFHFAIMHYLPRYLLALIHRWR